MESELANWLVAVAAAVSLHSLTEPLNIRAKLARLRVAHDLGILLRPMLVGIDSRKKAYALGAVMLAFLTVTSYLVASLFSPSLEGAATFSIVVLLLTEVANTIHIDLFHKEIEPLTNQLVIENKKGKK